MSDALTPDPNAPAREPVPRVTAGDLSEPGFYFVDFGPGCPVSICEVFPMYRQAANKAKGERVWCVRIPGADQVWTAEQYVDNFRPRRVKRINPGVDAFAPDKAKFTVRVNRAGEFVLGARLTVWHGDPGALALVEMQANGNPGDLRVWVDADNPPPPANRLPATPAVAYFNGEIPMCPKCDGAHFPDECPSPTPKSLAGVPGPLARPVEPTEQPAGPRPEDALRQGVGPLNAADRSGTVAVPTPANLPGVPAAGKLRAFRDAHGPERAAGAGLCPGCGEQHAGECGDFQPDAPPGVRRTGDPADAQGDEYDPA